MSRSINIYLSIYQSNLYSIAQFHISGIMKMNVFHTFFFIIEKFLLIVTTHTQTRITRFNALYRLHLSKGNRNDSDIKLENKMKWKNKRNSAELRQKKNYCVRQMKKKSECTFAFWWMQVIRKKLVQPLFNVLSTFIVESKIWFEIYCFFLFCNCYQKIQK